VKVAYSSKNVSIRHEYELRSRFQELLSEDPDLQWEVVERAPVSGHALVVKLELDGRELRFTPWHELKPWPGWVEGLAKTARGQKAGAPAPLFVTAELSDRLLAECKRHRISAIDLNGRAWLRAKGLLVDRGPLPGRKFRLDTAPRDIFTGKSARIVRCLLTGVDRVWTQAELVERTGASSGLVSRIVQHLVQLGFVEKSSARQFLLRDYSSLLDEWADADRSSRRLQAIRYAGFLGTPAELAHRLQKWAREKSVSLAFTQWIAAWLRRPRVEPEITSAYVSRLPDVAELAALGLRPVEEGGRLWLYVPEDDGLFSETQGQPPAVSQERVPQNRLSEAAPEIWASPLTLTTDAQIYLDLQRTGLRGPDAAAALREWEGFCIS
jgi:DNA-binding MarR family transcriptional regulator